MTRVTWEQYEQASKRLELIHWSYEMNSAIGPCPIPPKEQREIETLERVIFTHMEQRLCKDCGKTMLACYHGDGCPPERM